MFFRKPKETPVFNKHPDGSQSIPTPGGVPPRGPNANPVRPPANRKFLLYDEQSDVAALCDSVEAVNQKAREWFDDADDDEPLELIVAEVTGKITVKKETRIDLGPLA